MNERVFFKIFGKVVKSNKTRVSFLQMNCVTLPQGIYVPGELCYSWLYEEMIGRNINPNSTFYKSWKDVTSKTRIELLIDQIRHYASTYGTDFRGEAWLPEHSGLPEFPYSELKVLEGITEEEAFEEIKTLAYSNIAMSEEVLDFLANFKGMLNVDKVQNRSLKLMLIDENYRFKDGQECLGYILYKFFNLKMVIKNKITFNVIDLSVNRYPELGGFLRNNTKVLSSVFYRNKDIFMHFKKNAEFAPIINKIRRLAKKYHKPMCKSIWLRLPELSVQERIALYSKTPIFKLVQMYNALNNPTGYYIIRNGKAYYREGRVREVNPLILDELLWAIISKVPEDLTKVSLPKGIELAMPTSEKNFIGDIPLGSYINCAENNTMVGIYWKNEWGARDLDLHVCTIEGYNLGWNAAYYRKENDIIFSGDMTNASPEATEVMWFKNKPTDCIISVSEYRGENHYKYQMFVAQEETTNFGHNYMVDPRSIIYRAEMELDNKHDVTLGFIHNNKFIFHSCNIGNGIVPGAIRQSILDHLVNCSYLTVRDVLEMRGIEITDEDPDVKIESKGDLINLFTSK